MSVERRLQQGASYDDLLDEYSDKLGSYDEARRALGEPPEAAEISEVKSETVGGVSLGQKAVSGTVDMTPTDWKPSSRSGIGPQHGDSERELGEPRYFQPYAPPTAEQIAGIERGQAIRGPVMDAIATRIRLRKQDKLPPFDSSQNES